MDLLDELRQWIVRDLAPAAERKGWRIEPRRDGATLLKCEITTQEFVYTITADAEQDYLDCIGRTRRNAPGTNHPLFTDLPDGKLNEVTWKAIVAEIRRLELRPFPGPAL